MLRITFDVNLLQLAALLFMLVLAGAATSACRTSSVPEEDILATKVQGEADILATRVQGEADILATKTQGEEDVLATKTAADAVSLDRDVLVALYNATEGTNWTNSANWLSEKPIDEWYGVKTSAEGRVIGLNLARNQLSGSIPEELGNLSKLTSLLLGYNQLRGGIPPQMGNLIELKEIELKFNDLTGCISLELMRHLFPAAKSSGDQLLISLLEDGICADEERVFSLNEGPQIYNDNVFVMPVEEEIELIELLPIKEYTRQFYEYFDDAFDFIFIVPNSIRHPTIRGHSNPHFISVSNDVQGIGKPVQSWSNGYGSAGRLEGIIVFSSFLRVQNSVIVHELMHRWATTS